MSPSTASGKTKHVFQMGASQYVLPIVICMHTCIYMASHTDQYRQKIESQNGEGWKRPSEII